MDDEVYEILKKKISCDSLPSYRNLILHKMWRMEISRDTWEKTRTLSGFFNYPVITTKLQLEDLMVLGIASRKIEAETQEDAHYTKQETTAYFLKLSQKCQELIRTS